MILTYISHTFFRKVNSFFVKSIYYSPSNNTKIREIVDHLVEYLDSKKINATTVLKEFENSTELRKNIDYYNKVGIAFDDELKV
jgi:hypothetical protein